MLVREYMGAADGPAEFEALEEESGACLHLGFGLPTCPICSRVRDVAESQGHALATFATKAPRERPEGATR